MKTPKLYFFNESAEKNLSGVLFKNHILKKKIIKLLDKSGPTTINQVSKKFNSSSPKINTLIQELIEDGIIEDLGKAETEVGRRPNLYGLTSNSIYFLGVDVGHNLIEIGVVDFNENLIALEKKPYNLDNTQESLDDLCNIINNFLDTNKSWREKIVRVGVNVSGRVNHINGYSHDFFNFHNLPLSEILTKEIGITTLIENDTRARAFYEFYNQGLTERKNILFINVDWGLGLGVLANGEIQYGKSGYSGEFGHIPFFNNEIICRCGKKGCLETEVSGKALVKVFEQKIREGHSSSLQGTKVIPAQEFTMENIINAANEDDILSIEIIGEMASKLGKGITTLIHIFNPEQIIIGGALSLAGDYFFLPLQMAVNKFSINVVREDTKITLSKIKEGTGVLGACYLAKDKILNSK